MTPLDALPNAQIAFRPDCRYPFARGIVHKAMNKSLQMPADRSAGRKA